VSRQACHGKYLDRCHTGAWSVTVKYRSTRALHGGPVTPANAGDGCTMDDIWEPDHRVQFGQLTEHPTMDLRQRTQGRGPGLARGEVEQAEVARRAPEDVSR
jgi:hypothetical protein